jgi:hypothetical protein
VPNIERMRAEVRQHNIKLLMERDGPGCFYCDAPLKAKANRGQPGHPTFDHVHPKSKGGEDGLDNYVLSCQPCNQGKGSGWTFLIGVIRRLRDEREELRAHSRNQRENLARHEALGNQVRIVAMVQQDDPELFDILFQTAQSILDQQRTAGRTGPVLVNNPVQVTINNQVKVIEELSRQLRLLQSAAVDEMTSL